MFRLKTLFVFSLFALSQMVWAAPSEAGPLLDWLFGRQRYCQPVYPVAQPAVAPCATCQTTCQQTCSRVVVNYVPYTAYRTSWERVPVTTYRQTSSVDPCTGCTVTCNRPCTTYTYRMKQVPYTTYRPVYRTETYQVPVTYTSQVPVSTMPNTGCATCATGYQPMYQAPTTNYLSPTPANSYPTVTPNNVGQPTPADLQPQLNSTPSTSSSSYSVPRVVPQPTLSSPTPAGQGAPQLLSPNGKTTQAPSIERWTYSPVRLASYQTVESTVSRPSTPMREYVVEPTVAPATTSNPNEVWRSAR